MSNRPLHVLPSFALSLLLLGILPGCNEDDSSPTAPPPPGGPTITGSSGMPVGLTGSWRSRCFTAPPGSPVGSGRETFLITASEIEITIEGFLSADCSGVTLIEELTVDYTLGTESAAILAGQSVGVTRIDGTVRENNEPFRQILHVDDGGPDRLYHGEFDGATDADGYPTELFEEFLERQ